MSESEHPGTITYVDEEKGAEWTKPADLAPEHIRFVDTPSGRVPMVRAVRSVHGEQVTIREYGVDGQLLRTTLATH